MLMYHEAHRRIQAGRFEARTRNGGETMPAVNHTVRAVFGPLLPLGLGVHGALAAPSGPPVRIGSTLALTGPLAATGLVHKIVGERYIGERNRQNGLLVTAGG